MFKNGEKWYICRHSNFSLTERAEEAPYPIFMKNFLPLFLLGLLVPTLAVAAEPDKRARHALNLSLNLPAHPTDSAAKTVNLGLLSNLYAQRGVGLNVLSSMVRTDMQGVQASGLLNVAGQRMEGVQLSALMNTAFRKGSGAQVALLVNAAGDFRGAQVSALSNVAANMRGVQIGALNNVVCETLRGVQLTTVSNVAIDVERGLQFSSLANVAQEEMKGVQVSAFNYAGHLRGWQVGLLNFCERKKGWQVGFLNYSDTPSHRKIGLVNVDSLTRVQFVVFGGNTAKAGGGVRMLNKLLYTEMGVGTQWTGLDKHFSGCLYYRKGALLRLNPRWAVPVDLGFAHIESFNNEGADTPERMYGLQARAGLEWTATPHLFVRAMSGYGLARPYDRDMTFERKALFELSVVFEASKW